MTFLFDLDGTLTDSAPGILNAIRHALAVAKAPLPDDATLNRFIGPPLIDSFECYCGFSHEKAVQALADYREYFTVRGIFENSVYPGIVPLLEELNRRGHNCQLATAKPEAFARRIMDHFDLTRHFAAIHGATLDESRNHKDAIIAWALTHTADPATTIMVGDRDQDVQGAHANHLRCIGVLWGYGDAAELAHADGLAKTPADLLNWA